jgi:hypothetical protein
MGNERNKNTNLGAFIQWVFGAYGGIFTNGQKQRR